jgi:aminoglycoside phosphotransferase family enzyme/predicted kinase
MRYRCDLRVQLERLITELAQPRAYPGVDPSTAIECLQTHISVVFLVGREVFKIHKPVDFGFLDFTTLEARERDCQAEVEVNRELAPGVYRGVAAIVDTPTGPQVVREPAGIGRSDVIEWAVWMRRLPESANFASLLARGELDGRHLWSLAATLAVFYRDGAAHAAAHPELCRLGDVATVTGNVRENFEQLAALIDRARAERRPPPFDRDLLARIQDVSEAALVQVRDRIHERWEAGKIRDTHGDLRLDHVYHLRSSTEPELRDVELERAAAAHELLIIDRIEFTERFRWSDPIADVAFLIMDLQARGAWALARLFADHFIDASEDPQARELLPFYTGYRAMVRAKVAAMAAAEAELGPIARERARGRAEARARLALVELAPPQQRPCLVLIAGLPGSGKSVLARVLRETGNFVWIRSDEIRKRLAGLDPLASGKSEVGEGLYSREWTDRTYDACLSRAADVCKAGGRALVDATFVDADRRREFVEAAIEWGVPAHMLITEVPADVIRDRLAKRTGDPSDADWTVYQAAAARWAPVDPKLCRVTRIDARRSPHEMLSQVLRALSNVGLA